MSSLEARTGRLRQRYEDKFRLVSGCIPYRFRKDVEDDIDNSEILLEVLMISSPNRDDLVFPKGGWEDDETVREAACREALEEAGVKGIIDEDPLGVWEFRSKSSQNSCSLEGSCRGYMFALEVTEEFCNWAEEDLHRRRWLNVEDASSKCRYEWMQNALLKFLEAMAERGRYPSRMWRSESVGSSSESDESPTLAAVPSLLTDVPIMSPSCYINSSSARRLEGRCFPGISS